MLRRAYWRGLWNLLSVQLLITIVYRPIHLIHVSWDRECYANLKSWSEPFCQKTWLQNIVAFTIDELGLFLSWNMKVDLPWGTFSEGTLLFLESGFGDSPLTITLYGISSWRLNTGFEPIEGICSWFNQDKSRSPCNCFSHTLPIFCPDWGRLSHFGRMFGSVKLVMFCSSILFWLVRSLMYSLLLWHLCFDWFVPLCISCFYGIFPLVSYFIEIQLLNNLDDLVKVKMILTIF